MNEHWSALMSSYADFISFLCIPKLHGNLFVIFVRHLHTVLHMVILICISSVYRDSLFLQPCRLLLSLSFLVIATVTDVPCLIVVLICIALLAIDTERFFLVFWGFSCFCLFLRDVCSHPLPNSSLLWAFLC